MQKLLWPLLVHFAFDMLLGIIGIIAWGVGFIPQNAWTQFEKHDNLVEKFEQAKCLPQTLSKLHKMRGIEHQS
jgi:hypothetical protein